MVHPETRKESYKRSMILDLQVAEIEFRILSSKRELQERDPTSPFPADKRLKIEQEQKRRV